MILVINSFATNDFKLYIYCMIQSVNNPVDFAGIFRQSDLILAEGAFVERLKSEFNLALDAHINHAGLIYSHPEILETIYRQYISVAQHHQLPIMIMTPTRRVNAISLDQSAYKGKPLIKDACNFLNQIKSGLPEMTSHIYIGGQMGCKGNAYSGKQVFSSRQAHLFHSEQARAFAGQKIDFLFAGIMPEINEAQGMAMAMADTGLPYIISFMLRKTGTLLDGTLLSEAIKRIDQQVRVKPLCYMANCIHPGNLLLALDAQADKSALGRFCGLQANASKLTPEELDNCKVVKQDDFNNLVAGMAELKNRYQLKIMGGCCGTNHAFIKLLADRLASMAPQ